MRTGWWGRGGDFTSACRPLVDVHPNVSPFLQNNLRVSGDSSDVISSATSWIKRLDYSAVVFLIKCNVNTQSVRALCSRRHRAAVSHCCESLLCLLYRRNQHEALECGEQLWVRHSDGRQDRIRKALKNSNYKFTCLMKHFHTVVPTRPSQRPGPEHLEEQEFLWGSEGKRRVLVTVQRFDSFFKQQSGSPANAETGWTAHWKIISQCGF